MEAWAQLVCITDNETPPIEINKDKITIGRAPGNDVSLVDNKLVSGQHCYLERDRTGKIWLYDTSTNGTLVNLNEKLTKGMCLELQHGDEFHVVFKIDKQDINIGYMYQDLAELAREEAEDAEFAMTSGADLTEEYEAFPNPDATVEDDELNVAATPDTKKRPPSTPESSQQPVVKKLKSDSKTQSLPTGPDIGETPEGESHYHHQNIPSRLPSMSHLGERFPLRHETPTHPNKGKDIQKKPDCSDSGEKQEDVKDTERKGKDDNCKDGKKKVEELSESDAMGETLVCVICQEILHDCISLQPCMHSFCAGCYSDWMERSNVCPSCRMNVDRINKNHIVNNLVEAYLKEHPDRKRSEEDIAALIAKNKITSDMLYPKKKKQMCYDYDSTDYTDSDEDSVATSPLIGRHATALGGFAWGVIPPGAVALGVTRPPKTVCRQCPEYKEPITGVGGIKTAIAGAVNLLTGTPGGAKAAGDNPGGSGTDNSTTSGATGAGPSTGGDGDVGSDFDKKVMPAPPPYVCTVAQTHVVCQCCLRPMPDRRGERVHNPDIPPQQCIVCYRAYCHAYWGCRNDNCQGCIAKFKDMNFGKKCLPNLIIDNATESTIFKDYLDEHKMSVRDVLKECLIKLETGKYKCFDQVRFRIDGNTVLCYPCGLRNFKDLAYQFRRDIPKAELPEAAKNRADCYWGKNCRTQKNKPHHAANFNHICEQTRTT